MIGHKIKFSVVIPTCDRHSLLKQTLESVSSQSLPPFEILIIDNGNEQIDAKIFELDKRVKYIRALPRIGVAQARNMGICLANGDYIAFLDDDDAWDENYLKEVAGVIDKTGVSVVLGSVKILETGRIWRVRSEPIKSLENLKYKLLRTNPGTMGSNTVVERKLILSSSGFDPFLTSAEDKALVLDLLLKHGVKVSRAEKAFVHYRTVIEGGRLADRNNLLNGNIRFLFKYWKKMDFPIRLNAILYCLKLGIKNAVGIEYIRKRHESVED